MAIEEAIFSLLNGDAGLSSLVGERIYPRVFPQPVIYPAIKFARVAGLEHYHMKGRANLENGRWQFDCDAETDDDAVAVRRALIDLLSGYSGPAGDPPVSISAIMKVMDRDGYDSGLAASLPRIFRKTLDFEIWFKDS